MRDLWRLKAESNLAEADILTFQQPEIKIKLWMESEKDPVIYSIWKFAGSDNNYIVEIEENFYFVGKENIQMMKEHLAQIYAQVK